MENNLCSIKDCPLDCQVIIHVPLKSGKTKNILLCKNHKERFADVRKAPQPQNQKIEITQADLPDGMYLEDSRPSATRPQKIKTFTQHLISPPFDRFYELDNKIHELIQDWINSPKFKQTRLQITDIEDWSNWIVVKRIKKILETRFGCLPGKFLIADHDGTIYLKCQKD